MRNKRRQTLLQKTNHIILLLLLASCSGKPTETTTEKNDTQFTPVKADSCYTRRAVLTMTDSTAAFRRVTEGVYYGKIAPADALLMRAQIKQNFEGSNFSKTPTNYYKVKKGLETDSVRMVPERKLLYLDYLMVSAQYVEGTNEQLEYALEAARVARELNKADEIAFFDFYAAQLELRLFPYRNAESIDKMREAMERLEKANPNHRRIEFCRITLLNGLVHTNCHYEEALALGKKMAKHYEERFGSDETGIVYANNALAYLGLNDEHNAHQEYQKYLQTKLAKTPYGDYYMLEYLTLSPFGGGKLGPRSTAHPGLPFRQGRHPPIGAGVHSDEQRLRSYRPIQECLRETGRG